MRPLPVGPHACAQHGLAAVELALLLPIMLFFMFATAELGRALYQYNTLTKAARDSAQYLARHGMIVGTGVLDPTEAQESLARNLAVYGRPVVGDSTTALLPGLNANAVGISYQRLYGSGSDNAVTVVVNYVYQPLVLPSAFTLGGNSVTGDAATFTVQIRMRGV